MRISCVQIFWFGLALLISAGLANVSSVSCWLDYLVWPHSLTYLAVTDYWLVWWWWWITCFYSSSKPMQAFSYGGCRNPRAARESKPKFTCAFQASTCILFALIPLVRASYMATSRVSVGESPHGHKQLWANWGPSLQQSVILGE